MRFNFPYQQINQTAGVMNAPGTAVRLRDGARKRLQDAMNAPMPNAPQQGPLMDQKQAQGAALAAGLAALLGVRGQFLQQGLSNYMGGLQGVQEQNYQNQMLGYKNQLQGRENTLNGLQLDYDASGEAVNRADRDRADLLQRNDAAIARRERSQFDLRATRNNMAQNAMNNIRSLADAQSAIALMREAGMSSQPVEDMLLRVGQEGDRRRAEEDALKVAKVPIKTVADAKSYIVAMKLDPQGPQALALIERGRKAEEFVTKYKMTNEQKRDFFEFQENMRQAGRMDLENDKQAFNAWLQEKYINPRFVEEQNRVDRRTEFTQQSITDRGRGRALQGQIRDAAKSGNPLKFAQGAADAAAEAVSPLRPLLPNGLQQGQPAPGVKPIRREAKPQAQPPKTTVKKVPRVVAPGKKAAPKDFKLWNK